MRRILITLAAIGAVACSPTPATTPPPVVAPTAPTPVAQQPDTRPPKCFDSQTLAAVRDITRQQLLPGAAYKGLPESVFNEHLQINDAVPEKWDAEIARWECSATFVVDSSAGLDRLGQTLVNSPQMLQSAGSSVAELERVVHSDLSSDRMHFSYRVRFSSQSLGEPSKYRIAVSELSELRAFLTGSFIAAHRDARDRANATAVESGQAKAAEPAAPESR